MSDGLILEGALYICGIIVAMCVASGIVKLMFLIFADPNEAYRKRWICPNDGNKYEKLRDGRTMCPTCGAFGKRWRITRSMGPR